MKKTVKMLLCCILLLTLSCLGFLGSCTSINNKTNDEKKDKFVENEADEGITPYKVYHFKGFCFIDEDSLLVFDSRQAMEEYYDENGYLFFKNEPLEGREEIVYKNSEMSQKIRSYDDNYFEKRELIIITFSFPIICPAKFDTIKEEGEELLICITKPQLGEVASLAISQHTFFIEVEKDFVANRKIEVDISTQGDINEYDGNL